MNTTEKKQNYPVVDFHSKKAKLFVGPPRSGKSFVQDLIASYFDPAEVDRADGRQLAKIFKKGGDWNQKVSGKLPKLLIIDDYNGEIEYIMDYLNDEGGFTVDVERTLGNTPMQSTIDFIPFVIISICGTLIENVPKEILDAFEIIRFPLPSDPITVQ